MATDAEWAWFAGLFEGEGCIGFVARNSVGLNVTSTDRDVIERCLALTGVGTAGGPYRAKNQPHWKPKWAWYTSDATSIAAIFDHIEPWLGNRRREKLQQARARLEHVRKPGYCKRDHPMSGENLYVSPQGERQCRACRDVREEARRGVRVYMPPPPKHDLDVAEIRHLYIDENLSARVIGERLGVPTIAIYHLMKREGIRKRPVDHAYSREKRSAAARRGWEKKRYQS